MNLPVVLWTAPFLAFVVPAFIEAGVQAHRHWNREHLGHFAGVGQPLHRRRYQCDDRQDAVIGDRVHPVQETDRADRVGRQADFFLGLRDLLLEAGDFPLQGPQLAAPRAGRGPAPCRAAGGPGRSYGAFLEDLHQYDMQQRLAALHKPVLIFKIMNDALVDSENADEISAWTGGPSCIVTMDKADHLLSNKDDARFVADEIAAWFKNL